MRKIHLLIVVIVSLTGICVFNSACDKLRKSTDDQLQNRFYLETVYDLSDSLSGENDKVYFEKHYKSKFLYLRDDSVIDVYTIKSVSGRDAVFNRRMKVHRFVSDSMYQFVLLCKNANSELSDTVFSVIRISKKFIILTKKYKKSKLMFVFRCQMYE